MNDNETRLLAHHMGHDYNIHMKHYAMQTNLLERSKVARVLSAISRGTVKTPTERMDIDQLSTQDADVLDAEPEGGL